MKATPDDVDVQQIRSIIRAIVRQRDIFADETASFFLDVDVTMAQFRALVALRRWGRQSGRELARRLRVTPGTLVPMIDRLEELGYLRRVPDEEDRRTTWLELTPKTEAMFHRLWGLGAARLATAVGRLIPKDRAELARLLNQVASYIESPSATENQASA